MRSLAVLSILLLALLAWPAGRAAQPASAGAPPDARTLACFLLNSMTRSAPALERREVLLQAALANGCLALPGASPFRGGARQQAQAPPARSALPRATVVADLADTKARHAADPLFRKCLLWAYTGYPSGLDETYCTGTFYLLPSGFALTCDSYLKSGFPTPLDRKACQLFWRERLQKASEPVDPS
jgi:hypothetical protein